MGISALIGAISLVGFLLFLVGIGQAVVSASQGRPIRTGVLLSLVGLVIGLLFSVISSGIIVVEPQERAVVFNIISGDLSEPSLSSGTHVIIPILQVATIYDVSQQEYTMSDISSEGDLSGADAVEARTRDGQQVRLDITVIYNANPEAVNQIHQRWQNRYEREFVRPTLRSEVRTVVARYVAEGIYGQTSSLDAEGEEVFRGRAEMQRDIENAVLEKFAEEGLQLTNLLVRNINFSSDFAQSIEEKEIEQQRLERAQTEAQRRETEAVGLANAEIAKAEGEKQARILRAEAEAEALRLVSEQIANNPSLVDYLYVQNLSDNISIAIVPSNSPFLFDFRSLQDSGITTFTQGENRSKRHWLRFAQEKRLSSEALFGSNFHQNGGGHIFPDLALLATHFHDDLSALGVMVDGDDQGTDVESHPVLQRQFARVRGTQAADSGRLSERQVAQSLQIHIVDLPCCARDRIAVWIQQRLAEDGRQGFDETIGNGMFQTLGFLMDFMHRVSQLLYEEELDDAMAAQHPQGDAFPTLSEANTIVLSMIDELSFVQALSHIGDRSG